MAGTLPRDVPSTRAGQRDPAVTGLIEYMSSIGSMSLQVDSGDLNRALQRTRQLLGDFIRSEAYRSILIHNRAEGLTVWLQAPHGADISNSFSFTKKDAKYDGKTPWVLAVSTQSGIPDDMPRLSEEDTVQALASAVQAPSAAPLTPAEAPSKTPEEIAAEEKARAEKRAAEAAVAERARQLRE